MIKRPLVIITISYIIGIIIGLYLKIDTALFVFLYLIIIVIVYIIFLKYFHSHAKFNTSIYIIALLVLLMSFYIVHKKENKFNTLYNNINSEAVAIGTVVEIQKDSEYYDNYVIKINYINNNSKFKNTNILLKVKKDKVNKPGRLDYGNSILFYGDFESPSTRRNYKGFDYSQYLKQKNIFMICKSDYNSIHIRKQNTLFVGNLWINKIRNTLEINLNRLLNEKNANVANAILLGNKADIGEEQRQIFSDASLIHVIAISGMHVSYVVLFWNFILKKTDKRRTKYFIIIFLIFFANLVGGSPSVIRASIMSCIAVSSKLVYRKSDTINNIAISCLFILIINPYNLLNLGFQLSFLGTLGIVLFNSKITSCVQELEMLIRKKWKINFYINLANKSVYNSINKLLNKIKSIIILGISANILIIPILIYTYNIFSLTFIISTILVTPILGLLILMGYLTVIISVFSVELAFLPSIVFNFFINIFNKIAEFCSNILFLRFIVVTPSLIEIISYYFVVFYFFLCYHKKHGRVIYKVLIILVFIFVSVNVFNVYNRGLRLYFIDVGQGDSCLIITETNKTILLDGGGSETGSFDVGKNILVPYLLDRKIKKIDYMIISHFDSDHCKGLFSVIEKLQVKNVVISEQGKYSDNYSYFLKLIKEKNINLIKVSARRQIDY